MSVRLSVRAPTRRQIESVQAAANGYCLCTYGGGYVGGTPRRLTLSSGPVWIVPVMFASAGVGHVGEVGVVALSSDLEILDASPKTEVRSAGARLAREHRDALDTAFHRARAT